MSGKEKHTLRGSKTVRDEWQAERSRYPADCTARRDFARKKQWKFRGKTVKKRLRKHKRANTAYPLVVAISTLIPLFGVVILMLKTSRVLCGLLMIRRSEMCVGEIHVVVLVER
jgi:hypothetical protein